MSEQASGQVPGWERGRGWGWVWGPEDQVGALNALDDAARLRALALVRQGRVFDLGVVMDRSSYLGAAHVGTEVVAYRTPRGLVREGIPGFDPGSISFQTSMVVISDHAGTQIDGLCHATFGDDAHWYNGYRFDDHMRDFGPTRAGAEGIPPVIAPGVLIDVAGARGEDELPANHPIGVDELEAALAAQGTEVEVGDVVLVRTGAMRHWDGLGHDHARIAGPDTAGLTLASARWLVEEKGAVLVGSDTSTVEVVPAVDGDCAAPVHKYLLVDQGVHMGELHDLEGLAAAGVHRFCYVALTPKVRGTTAGFALRPVALV